MHERLLKEYVAGPANLAAAVAGMTREQLVARPIAGKWSTLEVVCHVVDMDGVFAERMKRALAEERPTLANADENAWAATLAYDKRDVTEELAVLESTRRQMARILAALSEAAWSREGVHSTCGVRSLVSLVETVTRHVDHHLPFIAEKRRALGA